MHTKSTWRFGTTPTALTGEMLCIQHYHFGAVIALHCPGGLGESPTSRPCEASRYTLFVVVILMRAWTIHYGRDVFRPIVISVLRQWVSIGLSANRLAAVDDGL